MLALVCIPAAFHAPLIRAPLRHVVVKMETPPPADEESAEAIVDAAEAAVVAAPPPAPVAPPPAPKPVAAVVPMGTTAEFAAIQDYADDLCPGLGYWDPLNLCLLNFWNQGEAATIGFLRHAEIKHGRVAMAGFVGYIIHENGIRWPWALVESDPTYSAFEGLSAPAVWDATPTAAKVQIILFIGFLEAWSETTYVLENDGQKHYMRGGKPGYFPTFDLGTPKEGSFLGWGVAHPVPFNLYDPFNFSSNMSEQQKARRLLMEVNNGRAAMLGLMGFLVEAVSPGAVPFLRETVKTYTGNVMEPFALGDAAALFQ